MVKFSYSTNEEENTITFWKDNMIVSVLSDIPQSKVSDELNDIECSDLMWEVLEQAGLAMPCVDCGRMVAVEDLTDQKCPVCDSVAYRKEIGWRGLNEKDLQSFISAYGQYITDNFERMDGSWFPVCLNEFFDWEYQNKED